MAAIREAAANKLRDAHSAQFERLQRATRPNVRGEPTEVVCGYVNAKNAYGGYVGRQPFIYFVARRDFHYDPADSVVIPAMLKTFCTGLL